MLNYLRKNYNIDLVSTILPVNHRKMGCCKNRLWKNKFENRLGHTKIKGIIRDIQEQSENIPLISFALIIFILTNRNINIFIVPMLIRKRYLASRMNFIELDRFLLLSSNSDNPDVNEPVNEELKISGVQALTRKL